MNKAQQKIPCVVSLTAMRARCARYKAFALPQVLIVEPAPNPSALQQQAAQVAQEQLGGAGGAGGAGGEEVFLQRKSRGIHWIHMEILMDLMWELMCFWSELMGLDGTT